MTSQCSSIFQPLFTPLFLLSPVPFLPVHSNHYGTQSYTFSFNCPVTILTSHVVVLHSDTKFSPLPDVVWCSPHLWLHSAVWSNSQVRLPVPTAYRGLFDLVALFKSERITPSACRAYASRVEGPLVIIIIIIIILFESNAGQRPLPNFSTPLYWLLIYSRPPSKII